MMANGSDAYTDPADPRFNRHGSGFLWIGLPLFFAGALIASIVGTASRPRLLSLDKSAFRLSGHRCAGPFSAPYGCL